MNQKIKTVGTLIRQLWYSQQHLIPYETSTSQSHVNEKKSVKMLNSAPFMLYRIISIPLRVRVHFLFTFIADHCDKHFLNILDIAH